MSVERHVTGHRVTVDVEHRAAVHAPAGGHLSGAVVKAFAAAIPDHAEVVAVMGERGSQRDPEPYLRSLVATWTGPASSGPVCR